MKQYNWTCSRLQPQANNAEGDVSVGWRGLFEIKEMLENYSMYLCKRQVNNPCNAEWVKYRAPDMWG